MQNFFAPLQRQEKQEKKDTSAGFFGLLVALHLCGRVDIYGFTQQQVIYPKPQTLRGHVDIHSAARPIPNEFPSNTLYEGSSEFPSNTLYEGSNS